ncbi:MAG: hypothetical protein H5T44_06060 [Thermoplasmatales archaeon]|nr:hypothetical protein [Thermoplasmatales archaeon]
MKDIDREIEKILEDKYKDGKKIIRLNKQSRDLLEELKKECPHVDEKELISLFKSVAAGTKMVDSAIIASAYNMEYNITHPSPQKKFWLEDIFPKSKIKRIKDIMKNKKVYKELIKLISEIESKYDGKNPPDNSIFVKKIESFLRKVKI